MTDTRTEYTAPASTAAVNTTEWIKAHLERMDHLETAVLHHRGAQRRTDLVPRGLWTADVPRRHRQTVAANHPVHAAAAVPGALLRQTDRLGSEYV